MLRLPEQEAYEVAARRRLDRRASGLAALAHFASLKTLTGGQRPQLIEPPRRFWQRRPEDYGSVRVTTFPVSLPETCGLRVPVVLGDNRGPPVAQGRERRAARQGRALLSR